MGESCLHEYTTIEILKRFTELPIIHFETNLVNHCNLNCKGCDHISPLAKEWYADVSMFKKDMSRMSVLFDGEAQYIRLVGGEPLLHPQVSDFFFIARKFFNNANIEIWTNGLLLEKMNDSFWDSCRSEKITIKVTKYPIEVDYEIMKKISTDKGVELEFFCHGEIVSYFNNNSFDIRGKQDPRASFIQCDNANRHITLSQGGNIYTCDKVPHIGILNEALGLGFKVLQNDYINIYDDVTAEEIFRFLARPKPFCRFCNISERKKLVCWGKTERKCSEWCMSECGGCDEGRSY